MFSFSCLTGYSIQMTQLDLAVTRISAHLFNLLQSWKASFAFTDRHFVEKMWKWNVLAIDSKSASFLWETVYRRNLRRCSRCCWTCAAEFYHRDHLDHLHLLQHFTPLNPIRVYTSSSLMFYHWSYSHYGVNINNTSNHVIKIHWFPGLLRC